MTVGVLMTTSSVWFYLSRNSLCSLMSGGTRDMDDFTIIGVFSSVAGGTRDMGEFNVFNSVFVLSVDGDLLASRNLTFDLSFSLASLRISEGDLPLNDYCFCGVSIIDSGRLLGYYCFDCACDFGLDYRDSNLLLVALSCSVLESKSFLNFSVFSSSACLKSFYYSVHA